MQEQEILRTQYYDDSEEEDIFYSELLVSEVIDHKEEARLVLM